LALFSFPKEKKLTSNTQFKSVLDSGARYFDSPLLVFICENGLDFCRLGVSVGKNSGNAVKRNRIKRVLREVFRTNQANLPVGVDIVMMVSRDFAAGNKLGEKSINFHEINEKFVKIVAGHKKKQSQKK